MFVGRRSRIGLIWEGPQLSVITMKYTWGGLQASPEMNPVGPHGAPPPHLPPPTPSLSGPCLPPTPRNCSFKVNGDLQL